LSILKTEHQKVRENLLEIQSEKNSFSKREKLLVDLARRLYRHFQKEEKFLYTPLLEKSIDWRKVLGSFDEHKLIEIRLEEISLEVSNAGWLDEFSKFATLVVNHIDNEGIVVFKLAEETLTSSELKYYGEQYLQKKQD
jgi:hemerythrin-like domain-containing protein